MLRSHLPALFLASLQHFAALAPPEGGWRHHWVNWWLQAVPLEGEAQVGRAPRGAAAGGGETMRLRGRLPRPAPCMPLTSTLCCAPPRPQGFFAPLPRSIAALLRAVPCVPTEAGELVAPTQAAVRGSCTGRATGPRAC